MSVFCLKLSGGSHPSWGKPTALTMTFSVTEPSHARSSDAFPANLPPHSTPAAETSWLFFEPTQHVPTPRCFCTYCLLCPHTARWFVPSLYQDFCSNEAPGRPSLIILKRQPSSWPPGVLLFFLLTHSSPPDIDVYLKAELYFAHPYITNAKKCLAHF